MKFEFLGKLRDGDDDDGDAEKDRVPIDEVSRLSQQGYSQHQITEELRDRGYSYSDINKAMNRAIRDSTEQGSGPTGTTTGSAGQGGGGGMDRGGQEFGQTDQGRTQGQQSGSTGGYQQQDTQQQWDQQQPQTQQSGQSGDLQQGGSFQDPSQTQQQPAGGYSDTESDEAWSPTIDISPEEEELIETIIEEKVIDIEDEIESIYTRIEDMEERLESMADDVEELKIRKDEDEREFLTKINEMEDYLESSQSRIGGLEKAFQQTLPSLVDNVRDLTELVEDMREEQEGY